MGLTGVGLDVSNRGECNERKERESEHVFVDVVVDGNWIDQRGDGTLLASGEREREREYSEQKQNKTQRKVKGKGLLEHSSF